MADFFKKLEAKGGRGPQFLSDHPNPGNRKAAIQKQIREWPARKYSSDSAEFAAVRKHAASVRAYTAQEVAAGAKSGQWAAENQKSGAVLPGGAAGAPAQAVAASVPTVSVTEVQPSSNFRNTDLGAFTIDRPENWEVMADRQSSSATIAPRAGVSGEAVAYGVVINAVRAPDPNMTADQLTSAIIQSLQNGDSSMKQIGGIEPLSVDGISGRSVELESNSPMADAAGKTQRERDWVVTVPRGQGQAIFFVFVSPQSHFDQLRPTFERMLRSVQF
jgi:hypothetical protein